MEIVLYVLLYIILLTFAYGAVSAAPWIPTRRREREKIVESLPLRAGATLVELGCGDANVLFAALRREPGLRAVGYDVAIVPLLFARMRRLFGGAKYRNLDLRWRDFFTQDLTGADMVFVFLLASSYPKLKAKFARELRDDCAVAVEAWPMPGIEAERTVQEQGVLPLYLYRGRQFRAAEGVASDT
ncbi:hypothetical protein A3C96_02045 [Candidatus Uhrbacteria bacterium RIFCSPHIGHO2_02_FULL_60_10]|uniref:Methyltransferase domain-containing protein n=1 Tax=Candidatus Uhrbacteria bacterium RIFCSPHIGHO2_02_FULL_60_10 TaxID=1802392 RepID=A0A1F7U7M9_9BACT|nr:MAG: hypothetical protein A3C96_02045 [Candidatus Uhrbacteria bacterium RIFCSPHIGHO2_02_FULL_60_10]